MNLYNKVALVIAISGLLILSITSHIAIINIEKVHRSTVVNFETQVDSLAKRVVSLSDSLRETNITLKVCSELTVQNSLLVQSSNRLNAVHTKALKGIFKHLGVK